MHQARTHGLRSEAKATRAKPAKAPKKPPTARPAAPKPAPPVASVPPADGAKALVVKRHDGEMRMVPHGGAPADLVDVLEWAGLSWRLVEFGA